MNGWLTGFALMVALSSYGQSTNAPPTAPEGQVAQLTAQAPAQAPHGLREPEPNEIFVGSLSYSGIGVEASKEGYNPLQLFNPAAPPQYGSPEENIVRDPISGKISGLKMFSLRFW